MNLLSKSTNSLIKAMTPTRKYWIALAVAAAVGAAAFSTNITQRMAVGALIFGGTFVVVTRPRN